MTSWHTFSLFLHLIGVAFWLGGIAFFLVVFGPAVHDLDPRVGMRVLNQGRIFLEAISWAGIALLLISGMVHWVLRTQEANVPQDNLYGIVLSVKLLLFVAMGVHHGLQVFKYAPRIDSLTAALSPDTRSWPEPLLIHWHKWFLLLKINATIGPVVVLLGLALAKI
jgi:putative copper export protein